MRNALHWIGWPLTGMLAMWPVAEVLQPPQLAVAVMGGAGVMVGYVVAAVLINWRDQREHDRVMRS